MAELIPADVLLDLAAGLFLSCLLLLRDSAIHFAKLLKRQSSTTTFVLDTTFAHSPTSSTPNSRALPPRTLR